MKSFFKLAILSFFVTLALGAIVQAAAYDVTVEDIIFERVDGVDPQTFCYGDTIRVSAKVYVSDYDPDVEVILYVNGNYYDLETVSISSGTRIVTFSRLVYASYYSGEVDVEVKAIADGDTDVRAETFYVGDCNYDYPYYYYPYEYDGNLRVRVRDCGTASLLEDVRVDVYDGYRRYDPVGYTNNQGYMSFSLSPGSYTVTVSKPGYSTESKNVYVASGQYRYISFCMNGKRCTQGFISNYQCFGPYVRQEYQYSDCTTAWRLVDYCPYGCSDGDCLPPKGTSTTTTTTTTPATTTTTQPAPSTEVGCEIWIIPIGIIVFILILLLISQVYIKPSKNIPEEFKRVTTKKYLNLMVY